MSFGSSGSDSSVKEAALASGRLELDLTDGLTREEVGLPEGRSTATIGHTGGQPRITVAVTLPGGGTVERDVADVTFSPEDVTDPGAEPRVVDLSQRDLDLDEARAGLERSIDDLGLDADEVAAWIAEASEVGADGTYATRVFAGEPRGDLRIEVEVAHHPDRDRFGLRTLLTLTT